MQCQHTYLHLHLSISLHIKNADTLLVIPQFSSCTSYGEAADQTIYSIWNIPTSVSVVVRDTHCEGLSLFSSVHTVLYMVTVRKSSLGPTTC